MDSTDCRPSKPRVPRSIRGRRAVAVSDRFWSKVDRSGGPEACWPWKAHRDAKGYGKVGREIASRVAHRLATGVAIPPDAKVRHRCDNPPCCNPAHLVIGTQAQNLRDMVERGRSLAGERNHNAKLSATQAEEVRSRRLAGESAVGLGREFGVSESRVRQIATGRGWVTRRPPGLTPLARARAELFDAGLAAGLTPDQALANVARCLMVRS